MGGNSMGFRVWTEQRANSGRRDGTVYVLEGVAGAARAEIWPADYELRLTYRLTADCLRLTAAVQNPDAASLPFGLGFHPYFRVAPAGGSGEDCLVTAAATEYWELADSLPTGVRRPVDG